MILTKPIAYKKVALTNDEYAEYTRIANSYTVPHRNGEELFKGMFEVNDDGIITMIRALGDKETSFEVLFFLMNLMQNQWLRVMADKVNAHIKISNDKLSEIDAKLKLLDEKIALVNK